MYLKSLEVQGFKSFPDRTLIRFGDDITAIVGPNGSGKSNISDAILWVMGEQSTKTLRGAKMEDVIFGGTLKRASVGFAEASLTLDNTDRALAYDADEVVVTRRYYRSGDGEYYINRQSARLRDIHELFMDTGLGREGYSNIGQGRIDEILSLKSGDRREIFEEAAGISKYRHRKEETERQLAHTEDNLLRIGDKVSELEIQLEPLKEQSEKAVKYLDYKEQLKKVEVAVWLDSLDKLSAAAQKAQEDFNSANFVLQQAHEELEELYAKAEAFSEELHRRDDALENARIKANMLESTHQQLDGQMAVLRSNIANDHTNIGRIEEELRGQDQRSGGIASQMAQAKERIETIGKLLGEKHAALEDLKRQQAEMTAGAQGLTRHFLELRGRETDLTADIAGRQADLRSIEQSRAVSQERAEQLQSELEAGKNRRQGELEKLNACRAALRKAKEDETAADNMISGYTLRQTRRQERRDALDKSVRTLTAELDSVRAKRKVFLAMERDFESYQKSVRTVMQEARRGGLRNIHGPVSRLIRTDNRYAVAIETALGGAMQEIVVDTKQDAKACISYLKRVGGRATFLPLSDIRGRSLRESGLENCRGFVGVASDLVKSDDRYRQIVENLLGRIVIVQDIDAAIAMSNQYENRFKIVTLDGQVMNAGGSMTGGAVNKEAGILSRANELEALTARETALTEKLTAEEEALREAQRAADEVEYQMNVARDQLRDAQTRVLTLQGEEKQYTVLLEAIDAAAESAGRESDALLERRKADDARYASQRAKIEVYTQELERIRAQLETLSGSQDEANEAMARITEQMTAIKTEEAALTAESQTAVAHVQDLEHLCSAMAGDRDRQLLLIETMKADITRQEAQLAELQELQEQNDAEAGQMRNRMKQVMQERADAEAAKTRTEREAQEKNKDILNMERACALLEQKKLTANMEERQIVDKLWDSYGLTPGTAGEYRGQIESVAVGTRQIGELKRKIGALGTPNLGAIEEYARVNERYTYLTTQRDDVLTSKRELESIIRNITLEMTDIFVTEFGKINRYFGQTFEEMFGGGKGQLLLEDPEQPLTCGIEIRVQPPGKQVKTITLLSGGEKAFVAIALYFAILKVRPTPFCMLDEIDAALDDRNVERFASYLHSLGKKTQFIVITHRRGTMEAADVLYGVTMQEQGISKLLRLDLNQMEQQLGIKE